jgi:hypothetical protein
MSTSLSETTALARLATCDEELHRVRAQRAAVVAALEQQRRAIASLKARPPRRTPQRLADPPPDERALADRVEAEEEARYALLVREFEEELERQAPRLVGLAEEVRRIEERRNECLRALPFRIQTAYAVRVAAGRLPAIACADGRRCGECGQALPEEMGRDDVPATIVICPACQRLVYTSPRAARAAR